MELDADFINEDDLDSYRDGKIITWKGKEYVINNIYEIGKCYGISNNSNWFYAKPKFLETDGIVQILYNEKYYFKNHIVAFEYMKNGKLISLLRNYHKGSDSKLTATIRCKIIYGVASILKNLHKNNIILVNLIDKIYLDEKLEPKIEISEYSIVSPGKTDLIYGFTSLVFARFFLVTPEFCDDEQYLCFSSDVFTYSIFLYIMFMDNLYYEKNRQTNRVFKSFNSYFSYIKKGKRPYLGDSIPPFYRQIIESCWSQDPKERPTFEEITKLLREDKNTLIVGNGEVDVDEFNEYINRIEKVNSPSYYFDDYKKKFHINVCQINEGPTSITYKVIDSRNNISMCKKVIKNKSKGSSTKEAQDVLKEFEIYYNFVHPCICKAIGINMTENMEIVINGKKEQITTVAIFFEYEQYQLSEILNSNINNTFKTRIIIDIAHAMKFLHEKGLMHRDLKFENIMINSLMETKIVDFCYVKINELMFDDYSCVEDFLKKGIESFTYTSPELANEEDYDNKTDIYSFGILLYEIFYKSLPKQKLKDKLNGVKIKIPDPIPPVSNFCAELISKCIEPNPLLRPSFNEILQMTRDKSFMLTSDVDSSLIFKRDDELEKIESIK